METPAKSADHTPLQWTPFAEMQFVVSAPAAEARKAGRYMPGRWHKIFTALGLGEALDRHRVQLTDAADDFLWWNEGEPSAWDAVTARGYTILLIDALNNGGDIDAPTLCELRARLNADELFRCTKAAEDAHAQFSRPCVGGCGRRLKHVLRCDECWKPQIEEEIKGRLDDEKWRARRRAEEAADPAAAAVSRAWVLIRDALA